MITIGRVVPFTGPQASDWIGLLVGGAIGAAQALVLFVILFLPDGILDTLQKKFSFEILSQKRSSRESPIAFPKRAAYAARFLRTVALWACIPMQIPV